MTIARSKPRPSGPRSSLSPQTLADGAAELRLKIDGHEVHLTNLQKPFWPELGITKGGLLNYYTQVSKFLLPHLAHRALVMKRYPNGAHGKFFFQKRAPEPRPDWIEVCPIQHSTVGLIDLIIVRDLATLLWVVNLGCIDLHPWYARCDAPDRPDFLHFDLDPTEGTSFARVSEVALLTHRALDALKFPNFAKTTGSRGIHVYVPISRGPAQKEVWTFAKEFAQSLERLHPELITAEYRIAKRPRNHVLVDYNQNAWGRTLASVYSVRPKPQASVSTPVTWKEIQDGIETEDFRLDNVPARLKKIGDLWKPLLQPRGRVKLEKYFKK